MMKRLLVTAILALATMSIANVALASPPLPGCYPCPDWDNPGRAAAIVPVEAR